MPSSSLRRIRKIQKAARNLAEKIDFLQEYLRRLEKDKAQLSSYSQELERQLTILHRGNNNV